MTTKKTLPVGPINAPETSGDIAHPALPALPASSGATWGGRTSIVRKDTEYVQQHAAYLQARAAQSDAMRDLVQSRLTLAVSLSKLNTLPEVCATEYLKGRRERARDLRITQLRCEEQELVARAAVLAARQQLEALGALPDADSETAQHGALTPGEVDELLSSMPDISEDTRKTLALLFNARLREKKA